MKTSCFVLCLGAVTGLGLIQSQGIEPLRLLKTIPIPSIEKRIDHLSVDLKGNRIFLAALGNNTVEVLLLSESGPAKSLERISGTSRFGLCSRIQSALRRQRRRRHLQSFRSGYIPVGQHTPACR